MCMKFGAYILIITSFFTFVIAGYKSFEVFHYPTKFLDEIILISKQYDLNCELVASVINVESSYNINAKSNKNAIGLMQIKPSTANYLDDIYKRNYICENDLFEPKTNIKYGCEYLKYLINKFNDTNTSLAAYNAGETRVLSWLKNKNYSSNGKTLDNIPYLETKNYVKKVNKNLKFYKKIYKNY